MEINIVNNTKLDIAINKSGDGIITLTIDDAKKNKKLLGDVKPGETVVIGGLEFTVLGHNSGTTAVITTDFVTFLKFGKTGNYLKSNIREFCNDNFYIRLANVVGESNIIPHVVNLTCDDGSNKGEICEDKVSIITTEDYRRYREYLPAFGLAYWTATGVTTLVEKYTRCVCCVKNDGTLSSSACDLRYGVRPFCILKSSVTVK